MISDRLHEILSMLPPGVKLVAVSKFKPLSAILEAYADGQRVFGESRPQEFAAKAVQLPQDIEWHFIGHLQTNKLKLVLPYAAIIESVDSIHLLEAIQTWCENNGRTARVLLEVHIGAEETKSGFSPEEIRDLIAGGCPFGNVEICGLMGMASNTDDEAVIAADFARIKALFEECRAYMPDSFRELSIGMSGDWRIALDHGATIVRIGTAIFGER